MGELKLEVVPTVAELAANGMARQAVSSRGVAYQISKEGQELVRAAMQRNAERGRAWDEAHPSAAVLARREREAARSRAADWAGNAFAE